jgi:hypothetical protein
VCSLVGRVESSRKSDRPAHVALPERPGLVDAIRGERSVTRRGMALTIAFDPNGSLDRRSLWRHLDDASGCSRADFNFPRIGEYGVSWIARREPCLRVGAAFAATAFAWLPTSDTSSLSAERLVAASAAGRVLVSAAAQHGAISAGLRVTGQPSVNRTILQPRSAVR